MYYEFERRIGGGAKLYSDLDKGLRSLTNYKINEDFLHFWGTVNHNIRTHNLPAISLRSSIFFKSWEWHYRAIIGTKEEGWSQRKTFLWHKWTDRWTSKWYLMWDNGTDGWNWWESEQYYHFHSAHVRHR